MTGSDVLHMLLGAGLVSIGFLVAALTERVRGNRAERAATAQEPVQHVPANRRVRGTHRARTVIPVIAPADLLDSTSMRRDPVISSEAPEPTEDGGDDVIAALVSTGYKKSIATEATWACSAAERATIEVWTAAALRRCARGGMS
jgi:hypothetical protein